MSLSQRLAVGTTLLLAAAAALYALGFQARPAARSIVGHHAPHRALGAPEIVASIDAGRLGQGPVVALADDGYNVFMLQNHNWLRAGPDGVQGPFGAATRGARGSIASGADIAAHDSLVYVLDRAARAVLVFGLAGDWRSAIKLWSPGSPFAVTPERIAVDSSGTLVVVGFRRAGVSSSRILLRIAAGRADSLFALPADLYDAVVPVAGTRSNWYAFESASYHLTELASNGSALRRFQRVAPPRVPLPDSVRRSLLRYAAYLPRQSRNRSVIPNYLPAVAGAAHLKSGSLLVAVVASLDSAWVEEIDAAGNPIALRTQRPLPLPMALSEHGIVTIREDTHATIIERRRLVD